MSRVVVPEHCKAHPKATCPSSPVSHQRGVLIELGTELYCLHDHDDWMIYTIYIPTMSATTPRDALANECT